MYYAVEKKLPLCLAIVMLLALLAGCHEDVEMASGTPSIDFESQAHIQVDTSDDDTYTPEEESQPPLTGDFVVNLKKYDYKGKNIELLHVENQTNRHFNITIKGKYLDKDGNVIKEETQKFTAFPAGWSNYFSFYPRCAFDSFTYELETEPYTERVPCLYDNQINHLTMDSDGNPLASYINLTYEKKLTWERALIGDPTEPPVEGRMLHLYTDMDSTHPTVAIAAEYHILVLDADGDIYIADYDYFDLYNMPFYNGAVADPVGLPDDGRFDVPLTHQPIGGDESIPDNVQGVFTVIFAVAEVYDYDDAMGRS